MVGVEEVGLAFFDQAGAIVVRSGTHLVPAHVRNFYRRISRFYLADFAGNPVEPGRDGVFVALCGEQLHAHADAEERHTAVQNTRMKRFNQALNTPETVRTGLERADTGQNDAPSTAYHVRISREHDALRAGGDEGVVDRVEVARAVIDQRDGFSHRADPWSRAPFRPCARRARRPGAWPARSPCRSPRRRGGCSARRAAGSAA